MRADKLNKLAWKQLQLYFQTTTSEGGVMHMRARSRFWDLAWQQGTEFEKKLGMLGTKVKSQKMAL